MTTKICSNVTGTGTFYYSGGGSMSALQINASGSINATLQTSINEGASWSTISTLNASDLYLLDPIPDARYKINVTSNSGTLSMVIS